MLKYKQEVVRQNRRDSVKFKLFLSVIAFIALLSITGCSEVNSNSNSGGDNQSDEGENVAKDNEEVASPSKPPSLTIEVGEETITPSLGTYSWSVDNGDGSVKNINADSAAPPELVKNTQPTQVTNDTDVELNFETQPQRYEVRTWEDNSVASTSDEITLSEKGKIIYEVLAYWENGTASYAFSLNIE